MLYLVYIYNHRKYKEFLAYSFDSIRSISSTFIFGFRHERQFFSKCFVFSLDKMSVKSLKLGTPKKKIIITLPLGCLL